MPTSLMYVLSFTAGAALIVQIGVNGALRKALGSPVSATLASFVSGSLAITLFMLLTRTAWPGRAQLQAAPGWAWFGGLLGGYYVIWTVIGGPRLGAATLLSLVILGQLSCSLLVDHFGWLGFPLHPLSVTRLAGAALLFCGVLLITR
jgi:bacterial/archaeal transporter family-2 protein